MERMRVIDSAYRILGYDDLTRLNWDGKETAVIARQVVRMIEDHNSENPKEMLPQTAETIEGYIKNGLAYTVVTQDTSGELLVLYFGKVEPLFGKTMSEKLDGFMVAEFGSAIDNIEYRGLGLGGEGSAGRVSVGKKQWGEKSIFISTIKRDRTAGALKHAGMKPVGWQYPYISALTCVCSTSELCGNDRCIFRREQKESTEEAFAQIMDKKVVLGSMPCTLMISDTELAQKFEEVCRDTHCQLGGEAVDSGYFSAKDLIKAAKFFEELAKI